MLSKHQIVDEIKAMADKCEENNQKPAAIILNALGAAILSNQDYWFVNEVSPFVQKMYENVISKLNKN